ncbi:MAG: hypothetical protein Q8N05_09780 [Bacteroidota bacterium]|nr:hypothetical protein [Bacteroidota bacterium]
MKDQQPGKLKIKSEPRTGWEKSFKIMHECGEDQLLIQDVFEDEDFEIWTYNNRSNESDKP